MDAQTVYDYMMEQKLFDHVLDVCETDEQKEAALQHARQVCAKFDPFIATLRESCKTDEDRDALLRAIMDARGGKKNAH